MSLLIDEINNRKSRIKFWNSPNTPNGTDIVEIPVDVLFYGILGPNITYTDYRRIFDLESVEKDRLLHITLSFGQKTDGLIKRMYMNIQKIPRGEYVAMRRDSITYHTSGEINYLKGDDYVKPY